MHLVTPHRELADAIPQLAWTTGPDGAVDWINRRWAEYTGLQTEELLAGAFWQAIAPEDRARIEERMRRAATAGEPCEMEYRIRRSDGAWRWHLVRAVPLRDGDGQDSGPIRRWLTTATDIDERHRAEDDLRASGQRFATLFHCNPQSLVITSLTTGAYLDVNPAFLRLLGLPREQVLGRTPIELGIWTAAERAALVARLQSNAPVLFEDVPFRLPGGRVCRLTISSDRVEFEGVPAILSVLIDVTARREAESALAEKEAEARARAEEMQAVLEAVPAAVWIAHDPLCRNVTGNRAGYALLRAPAGANLSKSAVDPQAAQHFRVYSGGVELAPEELPLQVAAREGTELRNFEEELLFDGGDRIHLYGNAVPLHAADGSSRGAIAAFLDVTRLKEAEAALRTADRRKDEFLAMLAHELRNPMAPILTAVQLMKLRGDPTSARERDIIERQAQYMLRLIDDLLDVSRIAQGKIRVQKQPLDLSRVVAKAVETTRPMFEKKEHRLHIEAPAGLIVDGDELRLTQIVCNLLTNAARYTPAPGEVSLSAEIEDELVALRVRDSGIGISAELLPRLFRLFYQGEHGQRGGLGLGLALSRSLAELHGGTVTAHSEGPGRGSEFVLRLPLYPRRDEVSTEAAAAPSA